MRHFVLLKVVFFCCVCLNLKANIQSDTYPEVGKSCPAFVLNDVQHYAKHKVTLKDFWGKWTIINCWNSDCCADGWCDRKFLEMDNLQSKYSDKVQFLLIGYTGTQYYPNRGVKANENIRAFYESVCKQENLHLPIAYDSTFFHRFDIGACPYVIVVDPTGIVRAITYPLNEDNLVDLIEGRNPILEKAYRTHEEGSEYLSYSKRNYPEVGKICPNFEFKDVDYYDKQTVSINEFKGRWLIIDCWNNYCSSCISSMPKTDSLQKKYSDKVTFLLVGYTGSQYAVWRGPDNERIRERYNDIRARMKVSLPIVYDSVFFNQNDIAGCPYIIIIDPNGIVRAITYEMTDELIENMLKMHPMKYAKAYRIHERGSPYLNYFSMDPTVRRIVTTK